MKNIYEISNSSNNNDSNGKHLRELAIGRHHAIRIKKIGVGAKGCGSISTQINRRYIHVGYRAEEGCEVTSTVRSCVKECRNYSF